MIRSKFSKQFKPLVLIVILVIAFAGCKNKRITANFDKKIIAMSNEKELIIENKQSKSKKSFNIPKIQYISIAPSGKKIAYYTSGNFDPFTSKKLEVLNIETGKIIKLIVTRGIESVKWSENSKNIFLPGETDGEIKAINTDTGKLSYKAVSKYDYFNSIILSPNTYLVKYSDGSNRFVILENGRIIKKLESYEQIGKIGNKFIAGKPNVLYLIDSKNYKQSKNIKITGKYYFTVSPDEKKVMLYLIDDSGMMVPAITKQTIIYDSNLKLLYRTTTALDAEFKDENNIGYITGENYKQKTKKFRLVYMLLNLKTKKAVKLGNWRQIDWLTESSVKGRILNLPSTGLKLFKDKNAAVNL